MRIGFTKVQASGNDFIIIDNRENALGRAINNGFSKLARTLSERKRSIGADGVLLLEDSAKADLKMRVINPDGSEVTMCGNGIRCSAFYAAQKKWCGSSMKIETGAGFLEATVDMDNIRVKMTAPKSVKLDQNVGAGSAIVSVHGVDTGVPHVVHFVEGIENYNVKDMGSKLRYHKLFEPEGTNADFVEVRDKNTIIVRTYERGVENETLACGTGVVASAIIANLVKKVGSPVSAVTRSGDTLKVFFKKEINHFVDVYLEGKAAIIFEGRVDYV